MITDHLKENQQVNRLRANIVGINQKTPLLNGNLQPYVYLDNAASTPSFKNVKEKVDEFLLYYSSIHRGSGFKSLLSTRAYENARHLVIDFVGGDPGLDVAIFGKNTTEAINTLACCFDWQPNDVVIVTIMEHHSNDLPWREKAAVEHFGVREDGYFDLDALETLLKSYRGRVRVVATTGASNVTGFIPPIYEIAKLAHRYGAMILVDCAQLAPHRQIDMKPHCTPEHLDFVCLSAHKMYAPYGVGALVGPAGFFNQGKIAYSGGGVIEVVTEEHVHWAEAPDRYEAGSPNVLGSVALAASIRTLSAEGMETIAAHEKELTAYALEKFSQIDGVHLYGSRDPNRLEDRVGVIPFAVNNVHHAKVAAILSFEGGIGVRNGCFCAHPYLIRLLGINQETFNRFQQQVLKGDRREQPGLVRASFGCYNTHEEIDHLATWLERITRGDFQGHYIQDKLSGSFFPAGYEPSSIDAYFKI